MTNETSGEQIANLSKIVSFTLWRIATFDPEDGYTDEQKTAIQTHAQNLFQSPSWIGEVVGAFINNIQTTPDAAVHARGAFQPRHELLPRAEVVEPVDAEDADAIIDEGLAQDPHTEWFKQQANKFGRGEDE